MYQQYQKISNLELRVTSPLQRSQSQDSAIFDVTGTASVYGSIIPIPGDVFIAKVDNGRQALFLVNTVDKATYMASSNYTMTYKLLEYTDPSVLGLLDAKVIQNFEFVKSLLAQGQSPLMTSSQYSLYSGLQGLFTNLVSMYFRDFFSVQRQTLMVPDQTWETYDAWLTNAVVDMINVDDNLRLPRVRQPTVKGDEAMNNVTVWDSLLKADPSYMITGIQKAGIVWVQQFRNWINLGGISYTGVQAVVYPIDLRTDVDAGFEFIDPPQLENYVNDGTMRYTSLERALREISLPIFNATCQLLGGIGNPGQALPLIVPVTTDTYYVFTAGFYGVQGTLPASVLEVQALNAINGRAVDLSILTMLAKSAFSWPNLERYYYIPVLLCLIKIALMSGLPASTGG